MTALPIPAELNDALGFNLYRVAHLFRNELLRALADYQMTPEQWQVMQTLWASQQRLNQNDVAQLTLKDKHTVSRMLARLERDGWIVRQPDPADARAYLIEPSAQAASLRTEVPTRLYAHFIPILGALDANETQQLLVLLKKLRATLGDVTVAD